MAIPGYMSLTDDAGNIIKGSVIVKDRENQIEVLGLYHNVCYNSDLHNGRALSKRQHRPFLIEKEIDASSVFLYKALSTGGTLRKATIDLYRINDAGHEEIYFTITLESVKVVTLFSLMHDVKETYHEKQGHLELVLLRYEKITWHYRDGNVIHMDDWDYRLGA